MSTKWMMALGAGMAGVALLGLAAGCGDEVQTYTALAITPAKTEIMGTGTTVFLTAFDPDQGVYEYSPVYVDSQDVKASQDSDVPVSSNLVSQMFLPLEWGVSDPSLGHILSSAGYSAVYESYGGRGQNIVTVHDQVARTGLAVVNHRIPEPTNTTTTATTTTVAEE